MVSCEFFIGLSSGLSWLAWACELPVVLISGFSEKWAETTLDTYRVINESVCHGCFNWSRLDAGDWNWCPKHKGTEKQFECSKQISSEMVIREINKIMNNEEIVVKSKLALVNPPPCTSCNPTILSENVLAPVGPCGGHLYVAIIKQ
jgi:hypothetical protein